MLVVLLAVVCLSEIASLRWAVDSRDGFDWRADDRLG
jgi:hypothetical protein